MEKNSEYQGKAVLEIMSKYAVNRNNAIEKLIVHYFRLDQTKEDKKILEFGAGSGEFINRFKKYPHLSTYAVEIDSEYFHELSRAHAAYMTLDDLSEQMDFLFTVDVLEHIENDEHVIKSMFEKLKKNGLLLIYVPARPELYSPFDKSIGHYRRYRLRELKEKVMNAGFTVRAATYDDFLGYFAALYNKFTTDGTLDARAVKVYDRIFVPITRVIESFIRPPVGKNIILVAEKNNG